VCARVPAGGLPPPPRGGLGTTGAPGAGAGPAAPAPAADQPPACDAPSFWLDDANIDVKGGTPYVILQTRYADGRLGAIRAEANCPRQKLEPTALKEAVYRDGSLVDNRMTTMSGADEAAVLATACARR
jgi:hypothetical protein